MRVTSLPFVLLASITLPCAAGQGARAAKPPQSSFPMEATKAGVETVQLIKVYRIPKWDTGRQGTATFTPPAGSELIVVRFNREPDAGTTLAVNDLALVDHAGAAAEPAPRNIYRVAVTNSGGWSENAFIVKQGTRLGAVIINDVRFSLEKVPIEERPSL